MRIVIPDHRRVSRATSVLFTPLHVIVFCFVCQHAIAEQAALERDARFVPWKEIRDSGVVKQTLDYSCGLAALATLLTFYFQDAVSEAELLEDLREASLQAGTDIDWKRAGVSFSLLHQLARERGYVAVGVAIESHQLAHLKVPAIAAMVHDGSAHFTVLRRYQSARAYLADPSWGNTALPRREFLDQWLEPASGKGRLLLLQRAEGGHSAGPGSPVTTVEKWRPARVDPGRQATRPSRLFEHRSLHGL